MALIAFAVCIFQFTGFGMLFLNEKNNQVTISGTIYGLPAGTHGLIVHEKRVPESNTCDDIGDHFDYPPHSHEHGSEHDPKESHHTGDIGNIIVEPINRYDNNIITRVNLHETRNYISLGGGGNSIIGRSIAIHRNPDSGKPYKNGNLGSAIACCTVQLVRREFGRS